MSALAWFDLNVEGLGVFDGAGHVAQRDRNVAVFEVPDVVRLQPDVPEHGGRVLRVLSTATAPCPQCGRDVVHWQLEERYAVACCKPVCGFVTFRRREVTP